MDTITVWFIEEANAEHRARQWIDNLGDVWRWHDCTTWVPGDPVECDHVHAGRGWQVFDDDKGRWRYAGLHIPICGPFTEATPQQRIEE